MSQPKSFRGTRKKQRSMAGSRRTPEESVELAKTCKHERKRFRNRSTEAVCLDCGFVMKVKLGGPFGIEVEKNWSLANKDGYEPPRPASVDRQATCYEVGLQRPGQEWEKLTIVVDNNVVRNLLSLKDYVVEHLINPPAELGTKLRIYHFLYEYQQSFLMPRPTWILLQR